MPLFAAPKFLAMPAVGFDISADAVRFIELEQKGDHLEVVRFATRNFPLGIIAGGHVRDKKKLHDVVAEFSREYKFEFANVALPEEQAYLANMRIPHVSPAEIRGAIELNLEEHVPISGADAIFDYEIVASTERRKDTIDVVVSVLPRAVVDEYLEIFHGTGITPKAFEFESQAMARALVRRGDTGTVLVVDIGKMSTGIFVVAHGVVQFSASIDTGGHYLTQAIERALKIPYDEAETLKVAHGLIAREMNKGAVEAMLPVVTDLKTHLLRHYSYWQTHHGEKVGGNIEAVYLTGGGANLEGLSEYLAAGLDVRVAVGNPWINVCSFETYIPPLARHAAHGYSAAIGLALRNTYEVTIV